MNKIDYKDIERLKFKEEVELDSIYENTYGIPYKIVTLPLRRGICVDWNQLTRICTIIKFDKNNGAIFAKHTINNLQELESLISIIKK